MRGTVVGVVGAGLLALLLGTAEPRAASAAEASVHTHAHAHAHGQVHAHAYAQTHAHATAHAHVPPHAPERFSAPPPIFIGGRVVHEPAIVERRHVLVPVRGVFEALHAVVEYSPPRIVVVRKNGAVIAGLVVDRQHAVVNNRPRNLAVAPVRIGGRVYVPLRVIAEMLGATVAYSSHPPLVNITVPSEILADEPPRLVGPPPVVDAMPPLWALALIGVCGLGLVVEIARRIAIATGAKRSRVARVPRLRS